MASLFTARRKPKRIGGKNDDGAGSDQSLTNDADPDDPGSLLRKPSKAPKARSGLRIAALPDEEAESPSVVVQRPSRPSRINSNAIAQSIFQRQRERIEEDERPSYSRSHLDQLRNSTPTTPRDLSQYASSAEDEPPPQSQSLDVVSKFGPDALSSSLQSSIPSSIQIAEAKLRRARLAVEEKAAPGDGFISLEDYDSDGEFKPQRMQIGLYAHGRKGDSGAYEKEHTRLIREDEDIAEGFDDFVEDEGSNRVLMGKKGVRDLERKEKEKVRAMIDAAEGGSDQYGVNEDEDTDSDASLRHAYETAQTSHGLAYNSSTRKRQQREARRPRQPEKTTPTPTLSEGLTRIRALVEQAELGKQRLELRKAEIVRRQKEIVVEKERIQAGLKELGDQLERSRLNGTGHGSGADPGHEGGANIVSRGLDNIGQV